MRYRKYHRNLKPRVKMILILIFFLIFAFMIDTQLRPIIKTIAASQAQLISNNAINEAVGEVLKESKTNYADLVQIERGTDGKILAITTDMVKMNTLKSRISLAIQEKITNTNERHTSVPLGTLLGGDLFRGHGPGIPLQISLSGSVFTEFNSQFVSAGINQTKHQIYLKVCASIYVLIPGYNASTDIETNVIVAETVIVGEVPDVYANTASNSASDIADLAQLK